MEATQLLLQQALELLRCENDTAGRELLERVVERADGQTWGDAAVELVILFRDHGELDRSVQLCMSILAAGDDLVSERAAALAGVQLALSKRDVPIAALVDGLARSARACIDLGIEDWGAIGIAELGHFLFLEERFDDARPVLVEAATRLERLGGTSRAAATLATLATLEEGAGNHALAIAHLERALATLDRHPFATRPGTAIGRQRAALAARTER